ncbi:hypothetical protein Pst134EA_018995 [Puccinia striiformis f. sp. tritici]|uniref:hypothetical protein n=1 Tax=Puccinia striiformis f. sp. tritici TaxID=168172 RepID=UPI0020087045|nr:hypothetical protein Pst134EA_018995 [Puccinia striiformis f. sp. tritici]KAH9458840.1 hypothetical protein Pst134EA_018995 [Puccinia striiformis f. sp. tritici]
MSSRLLPGSFVRAILNDLSHSSQVTLQPLRNRPFAHALLYPHRHPQARHHDHEQGRSNEGHPRLVLASGLGITLIGASGSFDSDQQRNSCETDFDTIRPFHTRQPSHRSNLPSFTTCPALDQSNSVTLPNSCTSWDPVYDHQTPDPARASTTELPSPHGLSVVSTSFIRRPSPSIGTDYHQNEHHQKLKKARSSRSIRHCSSQSTFCSPAAPAPLPFPAHLILSLTSASTSSFSPADELDASIPPQCPPSNRSTSFTTPLRSCRSLYFTKQKTNTQSRHPTNHHSISNNPQSRPLTPLTSPCLDSSSLHQAAPLSGFSSQLSDFQDCPPISSCPPELIPFPLDNPVTSQPTKFTHFVRSKIQRKNSRRSISQSRSSSLISSHKPPSSASSVCSSTIQPSCLTEPVEFDQFSATSCYRSISHSATCETLQSFPQSTTSPLSMPGADHEVESLLDAHGVPDTPAPILRSSSSQPLLAEQYRKKTLSDARSHSAAGSRPAHEMPRHSDSASSGLGLITLSTGSSDRALHSKPVSSTGSSSPPRNSVRTHLSRLAQFLTPSPTLKYPPVASSKVKIPSPPSDPRPWSSTGSSVPPPRELPSRQQTSTALNAPQVITSNKKPTAPPMTIINWRTTLSHHEYRHILDTLGPTEIHRQQLIWELCQTETAFLDSIAVILDLFIIPLRDESQYGTWVIGVPEPVQKLFGDLDQIANFHSEIVMGMNYNRMCEKKRNKAPVVIKFADMMAGFVPRLRIYERYLVCFERVAQTIDRLSLDPADHFGSFVRMQSHTAGFGAMTLTSFLLKPIQRLMKYPLFFRQLCETTPLGHPDHQATSNLWKATDGIIRLMQDVKGREDDLEALKSLEEQLQGLPDGLVLANRGRKIVTRGTLQMVYPSHKDILKFPLTNPNPEADPFGSEMTPAVCRRISSSSNHSSLGIHGDFSNNSSKGHSRCLSPVSDSSETSEASHSQSSCQSTNTESTFDATGSPQLLASEVPYQSRSTSGCSSKSAPRFESSIGSELNPIKLKAPRSLQSKRSSHKLIKGRGIPTEAVEVIILTDMLILCTREAPPKKNWRVSSRKPEDFNRFRVLDSFGLSRLTHVEDLGGQLSEFDDLVQLVLKPLSAIPRADSNRKMASSMLQVENSRHNEHTIYLSSNTPLTPPRRTGTIPGQSYPLIPQAKRIGTFGSKNLGTSRDSLRILLIVNLNIQIRKGEDQIQIKLNSLSGRLLRWVIC